MQCIGETFGVDPESSADVSRYSVKPATLMNIFGVFLNAQKKRSTSGKASNENKDSSNEDAVAVDHQETPADLKAKAEDLKAKGISLFPT